MKQIYCSRCKKDVDTFPVTIANYGPDFGKTRIVCKSCKHQIEVR